MHQMSNTKLNIENISIALIWLFHVSGILGIIYVNSNWFISFTPLNLTLNFILLLINCKGNKRVITIILLGFFIGMITEILGVQYGWIFGDYQYGSQLGTKLMGVPLLIGVIFFSQRISLSQSCGLILIVLASFFSLQDINNSITASTWKGDILFFVSAIFFSGYLILAREWNLTMMEVVFCSSILNCVIYLPIWLFILPKGPFHILSEEFLLQMFYQGIMPNVVGLLLVAYAAKNIGSAATAAFLAAVPPLSTILGVIFLDESLGFLGWFSVVIIVPGIILVAINRKFI
ncbi:MAG: hypothetical protein CML86_06205 [Rhodobiaceae bacterium]|nr:hypothetical protein [Rhodobiaceae bacterium]